MASSERYSSSIKSISPELLLSAYAQGAFPMADKGELLWFSPDPRGIIPLNQFRVPRSLRTALRGEVWEIRLNTCFSEVIRACAEREETWIDEGIIESYEALYQLGFAHSVETWRDGELVGGLYGVSIGAAFFGESMFHRVTNASKVALLELVNTLKAGGFILLDIQWYTRHLSQFGACEIPKDQYLDLLEKAIIQDAQFGDDLSLSPFQSRDLAQDQGNS